MYRTLLVTLTEPLQRNPSQIRSLPPKKLKFSIIDKTCEAEEFKILPLAILNPKPPNTKPSERLRFVVQAATPFSAATVSVSSWSASLGLRVQGLGFRVLGSGFKVKTLEV